VVFVPLLGYDVQGNRVGYGKGFYDAFLSQCKKDVVKIGLSFFEPEQEITDVLNTDIRLDYCVTPTTVYSFR
jgi:5-formyltetrahydrofolate cyclo-ligase